MKNGWARSISLIIIREYFTSIDVRFLKKQFFIWIALLIACITLQLLKIPTNAIAFTYLNTSKYLDLDSLWSNLTLLGDTGILWPMMLIFALGSIERLYAVLAAVPVGGLLSLVLKRLFDEPRPAGVIQLADMHIIGPMLKTHGFPSGHSITIFAAFSVILLTCSFKSNLYNAIFKSAILMLGAMVVISRIMVGAHWPFDCLAGVCIGWLSGLSGIYTVKIFYKHLQTFKLHLTIVSLLWLVSISNIFRQFDYPGSNIAVALSLLISSIFFATYIHMHKKSIAGFFA